MLKPRALSPGDRIAIVAPASPFPKDEFDEGIAELERLGFVPVYDESVFARRDYLAGPPELRAEALRRAWRDSSIAGVIAVRGGYGSMQVLPLLDRAEATRACKPFIGYSDLTAVLSFLTLQCGVVSFHGPMLAKRLGRGEQGYDRSTFERALFRKTAMGEITAASVESIVNGEAAGMLIGGTLTQIVASLGTPFAFDPPAGHVLFLDEVSERPYRIDRMLTQLRQSGLLARASAVVFNELPKCDEPAGEPKARAAVADLLKGFPGPVLFGFPSGHTSGASITLPFGVRCRVVADARPRLIIEESAVS